MCCLGVVISPIYTFNGRLCLFDRYGVLLPQRSSEAMDRDHTLALLNLVGAEEGQYQLGLTKVPNFLFMLLISKVSQTFNVFVIFSCVIFVLF